MVVFNQLMLAKYLEDDWIHKLLLAKETEDDKKHRTHLWLKDMDNKRMIFPFLYEEIIKTKQKDNFKVIDIGGGYSVFTKYFIQNCKYTLLDFMAHGEQEYVNALEKETGNKFFYQQDWYDFTIEHDYDLVIANDIFPDVDQRLEIFLDKFLPHCKELRILLTYYNEPKFYTTKRVDDTEVLTFLSWDGEITGLKLKKYLSRMINTTQVDLDAMASDNTSIYRNGRQVAFLTLKGDLADK